MLRWHKPNVFPCRRISLSDCLHRVFGFSPVVQLNCSHTWKLIVHSDRKWYHFVNPIMLLILYYTVATLIRLWLQEPLDQLTVRTEMKICVYILYKVVNIAVIHRIRTAVRFEMNLSDLHTWVIKMRRLSGFRAFKVRGRQLYQCLLLIYTCLYCYSIVIC